MPLIVKFAGSVRLSDRWISKEQVAWCEKHGQLKAEIDELLSEDVQVFIDELRGPGGELTGLLCSIARAAAAAVRLLKGVKA